MDSNPACWIALGVLAIALGPSLASAQAAPTGSNRIAYINLQAVIQAAPDFPAAESTFKKEMSARQNEVDKLQAKFDSSVADYTKSAVVLSPSAKQTKETQLRNMQTQLQQQTTDFQTKVQERERELIGPIETRVRSVIEGIRAERNISMIFDAGSQTSNIIAADQTLDITPAVLQRLKSPGQ